MSADRTREIAARVLAHFHTAKRELPWRQTRDPYAIWVSEIMLQQTRVATVIPYFERWMVRFPTVLGLAQAPLDDVLAAWSGLGYYSRARNLHRGAKMVVEQAGGAVPRTVTGLRELPGIGRYTAGAIASIAFGQREPVVDGNVARVLARVFEIEGNIKSTRSMRALWTLASELVPEESPGDFNQGLMELGATVCTPRSPTCLMCPLHHVCKARRNGRERELPHMPKRKSSASLPLIDGSALWMQEGGRVLLARRSPTGLYGGLWELPQLESDADISHLGRLLGALVVGVGVDVDVDGERRGESLVSLYEHRQTLTHRRLRIRVYRAKRLASAGKRINVLGKLGRERYDTLAWHSISAPSQNRGLSAAAQTIINALSESQHGIQ